MGYFPLCIDLTEKTVLLAGSGPALHARLEKLLPFSPRIRLFTPEEGRFPREVEVIRRYPLPSDLDPLPTLVFTASCPPEVTAPLRRRAMELAIPFNAADEPGLCTFYFPALITRGPVTVAVTTGGASPAAAAALRRTLEGAVPDQTEEIVRWAARLRAAQPRRPLARALDEALALGRPLTDEELSRLN